MSQGYVYALINPSLQGLVKVGKTTKEPEERAKEISSSTGVPTQFIVAYKVFVSDCDYAEKYLHTLLEKKGFRINQNREFFNAPLDEVINSMLELKNIGKNEENSDIQDEENEYEDEFLNTLTVENEEIPVYMDILEEAENYYYGFDDTIQDEKEALKLYKQAINLGAVEAYSRVGSMYLEGEGCKENFETALKFLKEGVSKGNENCYAVMGDLFARKLNKENSRKCFKKYFESKTFKENKSDNLGTKRIIHVESYLRNVRFGQLDFEFLEELSEITDEIYKFFQEMLEVYNKNHKNIPPSYENGMINILKQLDDFKRKNIKNENKNK